MLRPRNLLLNGLGLLLRRPAAVLWTFALSLGTALLFSVRLHTQLAAVLDHSLAAAGLVQSFNLATAAGVALRLGQGTPGGASPGLLAVPVFLLLNLLLVPGVLFCYLTGERARLATLLHQGLLHLWRFLRITLVTLVAFAAVLAPLAALNMRWSRFVDDHIVGRPAFLLQLAGTLALFLVASLLRLFFDLIEVYTVQLGLTLRPDGRSDRRVRRAFPAAWRALRLHLPRVWGGFLLLSLFGFAGFALLARTALHTLAQPRAWPLVLLSQGAVLLSIATRLWQRGAETTLALDLPVLAFATGPGGITATPAPHHAVEVIPAPPPPEPYPATVTLPATPPTPLTPPVWHEPSPFAQDTPLGPLSPRGDLPTAGDAADQPVPFTATVPKPATPFAVPPPPAEPVAPARTVFDIDPFTPIPAAPNPISAEEEDKLREP